MSKRSLEFKVGLLIALALVLLVGFVVVLGGYSLRSGYRLYVDFDYSGNLKAGAPVKVSGIKVGKVEEVQFLAGQLDERVGRRVQVRLVVWVEDRVRDTLRRDAEFYVNTAGVLGEQYLEIVPGDDYDSPPIAPGAVLLGNSPPRTDLIVSRLYEVLDSVSAVLRDDRELIQNTLRNTASAAEQVNALLVDNRAELSELIEEASDLAGQASETLAKVNRGIGDPRVIGQTLRDADTLLVTTNRSLTQLTPRAEALLQDATRMTGLVTDDRLDNAMTAVDSVATAAGKTAGLIDNVDGLITSVREGKGTAGALLVREEIYADLREMIRDLKRNPWKFFWKE